MKAIEFQSQLNPDHTLRVSASAAGAIPIGQPVRVLVLVPDSDGDDEWERLTVADFGQGYADEKAVYDRLLSR